MVMSPVLVQSQDPAIASKQQIARVARRIIARNYGAIARILNIKVAPNGLITVWFQDDDVDNKIIKMTIGDTTEYREVTGDRLDSLATEPVDEYLMSYANSFGSRFDAIAKPKNCKVGTSCKGACIAKGDICRDVVVSKQELSAINEAVATQQKTPVIGEADKYEGLNIRQLKDEARAKGILRYSYMTQDQLKGALRIYDQDPDFQENIRKGLQRAKDEATLKKVKTTEVGRALSAVSPALGKQFNLISAIGKKYENNPAEARILALSTLLGIATTAAKVAATQRKNNLEEAKNEASSMARDLRSQITQASEDSATFVVGSYKSGSGMLANGLSQSSNVSSEDKEWLSKETRLIPISREKEGLVSASDPIRAIGENIVTGYQATVGSLINNGRGAEATALAARLFVQGSTFAKDANGVEKIPAINIIAAEDGGTVARDALEILRKMPKSPDSNGKRGSDIADRIHLVTLGTPYFGLSKPNVPEANIIGDGDPWGLTPFTKGGSETKKVSGVSNSDQKSYLESSAAMDTAFRHLKAVQKERMFVDVDSQKRAVTANKNEVDPKTILDVDAEIKKRATRMGVSPEALWGDTEAVARAIASVEAKQRKAKRAKKVQSEVGVNNDSSVLSERSDTYKKIKCKPGYIQRGAVCKKQVQGKEDLRGKPDIYGVTTPSNAAKNLLKFGLPIASVAAIALTGKTVLDDVKKVTKKIEPDEIFLKAGEPVPQKVLDLYDKEFKPGDLIKRKSLLNGLYIEHYGIYAGDGKIIETYAKEKFGGSTLLKGDIGRPSESDGTRYVKVEDISDKAKPPSREQALKLAESMIGVPIKFDGVETNCEAIARLITQGEARTSQGEQLSWVTKSIGKIAAMKFGGKNLDKGFSAQEVSEMMKKSKYDPVLVQAIFADSVTRRKKDIERAERGDSSTANPLLDLRSPSEFTQIVDKTTQPLRGASKSILEQQMYKAYLVGAFGLTSKKTPRNDSDDYIQGRLDAIRKLKCKPGYVQRGAACQEDRQAQALLAPQKENPSRKEGSVLRRAGISTGIGIGLYLGINALDQKYKIKESILSTGYKYAIENGDKIEANIKAMNLNKADERNLLGLTGGTKAFLASQLLEGRGFKVVAVDRDNNSYTYKNEETGDLTTVGSAGSNVFTFGSKVKSRVKGFPLYEVGFKVNESFSRKEGGLDRADGVKIIKMTKNAYAKHMELLPDNCILQCEAWKGDELASKRQSIYEKNGFTSLPNLNPKYLFAVKNQGSFSPIPPEQASHIARIVAG